MRDCLLRIIDQLGIKGYQVRTDLENEVIQALVDLKYVAKKKKTKSVYIITSEGHDHINRLYQGRDSEISKEEFLSTVKNAYSQLVSPMKPAIKIPELRSFVVANAQISDDLFNKSLLYFHTTGELTLQTAMIASEAQGGIRDKEKHYYYVTME